MLRDPDGFFVQVVGESPASGPDQVLLARTRPGAPAMAIQVNNLDGMIAGMKAAGINVI